MNFEQAKVQIQDEYNTFFNVIDSGYYSMFVPDPHLSTSLHFRNVQMYYRYPENIYDVRAFLRYFFKRGIAFHPDTAFSDYTADNGEQTFSPSEAAELEEVLERCRQVCTKEGVDIYAQAFRCHQVCANKQALEEIEVRIISLIADLYREGDL